MFLLDLLVNGGILVLLGGGGVVTYFDYKRGFPLTRSLCGRVESVYLRLAGKKPNGPVERARNAVMIQETNVEKLRKSVASIAAASQVAYEESQQEILLAKRFEAVKKEALSKKDEESAQGAALGELEALKRANIQREFSEHHGAIAKDLEVRLAQQEQELLLMKDKKATIEVRTQVTEGMNQLYSLLSDVEAETGISTPRLILEEELKKSRHEELTAGNMIMLAEKRRKLQGKELPWHSVISLDQIQGEISALQKRIALPEKAGEAIN